MKNSGHAMESKMRRQQGWSGGRKRKEKVWPRVLILVFTGRYEEGKVSQLSRSKIRYDRMMSVSSGLWGWSLDV